MDIGSAVGGFLFGIALYSMCVQAKMPDIKEKLIGTLAKFLPEQQGDVFFIESISYEVDVCHVRHNDTGASRWYRIPAAGSGLKKLVGNEYYRLDFGSGGDPIFLVVHK